MQIKLTKEHFEEIVKKGYSLDHIFLLMLVKEGHDMELLTTDNMKLSAMHQALIRKGLITDENKISVLGQELLDFMSTKIAVPMVRKKASTKEFDDFWESFPSSDNFEHKGRIFTGSRAMRVQKESCKLKFNAILNEGVYTAKQIIDALKYIVLQKKEDSVKKKSNELTYLQNSLTFLNQGSYEPFIEIAQKGMPVTNTPIGGGTDI